MPRFNIRHITRYSYEQPVRDSANQVILFPLQDEHQDVIKQDLAITGDEPAYGMGPIDDVRESVAYLRSRFDVNAAA